MGLALVFIVVAAVLVFAVGATLGGRRQHVSASTHVELYRVRNERDAAIAKAEIREQARWMRRELDRELDATEGSA